MRVEFFPFSSTFLLGSLDGLFGVAVRFHLVVVVAFITCLFFFLLYNWTIINTSVEALFGLYSPDTSERDESSSEVT